jgi:fatty acid desaturase
LSVLLISFLQIEHHLFPSISHPFYPEISVIVRQCCLEYGVPYTSHSSWAAGVYAHFLHLYRMGRKPGSPDSQGRFPQRHSDAKKTKKSA